MGVWGVVGHTSLRTVTQNPGLGGCPGTWRCRGARGRAMPVPRGRVGKPLGRAGEGEIFISHGEPGQDPAQPVAGDS